MKVLQWQVLDSRLLPLIFMTLLSSFLMAQAAQARSGLACVSLSGLDIPAKRIGLATRGATIVSARATPAAMAEGAAAPDYCEVHGRIKPVDPTAPFIEFQVNLPAAWNGKSVQYGGGGFNGTLVTGLPQLRDAAPNQPTPLSKGYVTYGTDSGHQAKALAEIQTFALNDEALLNFAHAAYKKTHDVAREIMRLHYGHAPTRMYYFGGSEGGREGLTMAQRYPQDFDGIVSVVPVINWTALNVSAIATARALRDAGWITPDKVTLLKRAVLAACDGLDNLVDGIVSHYAACAQAFDPAVLLCRDAATETCFTAPQLRALKTLYEPYSLALNSEVRRYPAWGHGGEDHPDGLAIWTTGAEAPAFPALSAARQARRWYYASGAVRYFIVRDAAFDPFAFEPAQYTQRVSEIAALMDSMQADLTTFYRHGGRLILKENMADYAQSPYAGIEYYQSVVQRMGQPSVDRFMRLYTTPGAGHAGQGTGVDGGPNPQFVDLLGVLDAWVTSAQAPADVLVQRTADGKRSRPLCRYPGYVRYQGAGDVNAAENFNCAQP